MAYGVEKGEVLNMGKANRIIRELVDSGIVKFTSTWYPFYE